MTIILAAPDVSVPDHVSPRAVRDFDFLGAGATDDLTDWWAQWHDAPDIFYTPRNGGHWVFTRHDDIAHGFDAWEDFSSRQHLSDGRPFLLPPHEYDPPLHTDFRRLIAKFFSPKAIGDLEGKARDLTIELIEQFRARGECEFVGDFAQRLPVGIFMELVDLPDSDRQTLIDYSEEMVRGATPELCARGFQNLTDYVARVVAERRETPGGDILSGVIHGQIDGGRALTENEAIGIGMLLIIGGLDTVASMMGFIMIFMAHHPAHRRRLVAEPALIPAAVEELMRRFSIANMARIVSRDLVYKGIAMKQGDLVLLPTCLAAIDERRYESPREVDFDRADKRSLVFGKGPHQCIGAFLARTELRVFLEEWLKRIPEFGIKPGEAPVTIPAQVNAVRRLVLAWQA